MTRRTSQLRLGLPLVIAACAIAACAGGTSPTTAPGGPTAGSGASAGPVTIAKACDLLTDSDIVELTGTTVVSKEDNVADTVYVNHCRWTLQRPDGGNGTLDLGVLSPEGRERYDHTGGPEGLKPIQGLPADDAGTDDLTGSIFAVRGDTMVDVFTLSLLLSEETEIEVMRRVLDRLGGATGPFGTPGTGAQPTQGGGAAGDPCDLLTDQDIKDITGYAATGKESTPRGGLWSAQCLWTVAGQGDVPAALTLTIKSPGGRANWDQYMIPIQGEFTPIEGLGDAAFGKVHWPTHVLLGDTYFSVQYVGFPDPEGPMNTDLARRVAENLGG